MKALVVVFALLGIFATVIIGVAFTAVLKEDASKGESPTAMNQSLDEQVTIIESIDGTSDQEKKDFKTAVGDLKKSITDLSRIPIPLFAAAGLGLLAMILVLVGAGPNALHGGVFFVATLLPVAYVYIAIKIPLDKAITILNKYDTFSKSGMDPAKATQPLLLMVLGCASPFVLAALFAFLVKKKTPAVVAPPALAPAA